MRRIFIISHLAKENKIFQWGEKFFHSNLYIVILTILGIIGFTFKIEIYIIYTIGFIAAISWILCRDMLPSFIAMMIVSMTPLARYGQKGYFEDLYYILFIMVPAFIARLFLYPVKIRKGRFFLPTLIVAISITLGGLFFLDIKHYFSMPALYYVFGLGFGMLIINFILESTTPHDTDLTDFLCKMMMGVGFMGISMIVITYIKNYGLIEDQMNVFKNFFQWGNNLSNNLLISMPFAFYLSTKKKNSVFYFIVGLLQYAAMVLSFSRGGILFGTLMMPLILTAVFIFAKDDRKKLLLTLILLSIIGILILVRIFQPIIINIIEDMTISGEEARALMYKLAWKNFLAHPIFGMGLAHNPDLYYFPQAMCIYWYHSTFFQIIASLGLVGVAAYAFQSYCRLYSLFKVKSIFNLFVFFGVLGFAGYSMVNVGYFVPLPYMAMLIQLFIIVDRNNSYLKNNWNLMDKKVFYGMKKLI